jgi:hypothetical protein
VRFEELNTLGAASESREIFPSAFFSRVLLIIAFHQPFGFIQYRTMNADYERVAEDDSDLHDYRDKFEEMGAIAIRRKPSFLENGAYY